MTNNKPRQLPTIRHNGKLFFIDWRLREFRTVLPPLEIIPFDSAYGREIDYMPDGKLDECLTNNGIIVTCPICNKILFNGTEREAKRLIIYCVDCSNRD
jgi:hypothetical protein